MIAIESIRRFRVKDYLAIVLSAFLWTIGTAMLSRFETRFQFSLIMLFTTVLVALTVLLLRRAGTATLWYLCCAIFSFNISNFGFIEGWKKLLIFAIAGIIFELVSLLFHLEIGFIPGNIIMGAILSNMSIPAALLLFMPGVQSSIAIPLLNFTIGLAIIGLVGSMISFILWHHLSARKWVLRFSYEA